jgi:hypothetical protein
MTRPWRRSGGSCGDGFARRTLPSLSTRSGRRCGRGRGRSGRRGGSCTGRRCMRRCPGGRLRLRVSRSGRWLFVSSWASGRLIRRGGLRGGWMAELRPWARVAPVDPGGFAEAVAARLDGERAGSDLLEARRIFEDRIRALVEAELSPRQRRLRELRNGGCSWSEVAAGLGVSPSTARRELERMTRLVFRALEGPRPCCGPGCEQLLPLRSSARRAFCSSRCRQAFFRLAREP